MGDNLRVPLLHDSRLNKVSFPSQYSSDCDDVSAIDDILSGLQMEISHAEGQSIITRVVTFNLIVCTNNPKTASELIRSLAAECPCRVIVMVIDENAPDSMKATCTLYRRPSIDCPSQTQVYCEEIRLTVGCEALDRGISAVKGLLVTDVPVYLYHEGDISSLYPILMQLGNTVDRVILDSATFSNPLTGLCNVNAMLRSPDFKSRLSDLAWERLLHWREALAYSTNAQDPEFLTAIQEVEIVHQAARAEGLLALGWLASRLQWQIAPCGDDPNTWLARSTKGDITLRLIRTRSGPVGLQRISLKSATQTLDTDLSEDSQCLITRNAHDTITPIQPPETVTALVERAINSSESERILAEALSAAVTLSSRRARSVPSEIGG